MTDSVLLRKKIESKGLKLKFVAEYLGLSPYGFQLKVENKQEATVVPFEQVAPQISLSLQQQKQGERDTVFPFHCFILFSVWDMYSMHHAANPIPEEDISQKTKEIPSFARAKSFSISFS